MGECGWNFSMMNEVSDERSLACFSTLYFEESLPMHRRCAYNQSVDGDATRSQQQEVFFV